MTRHLLDKAVTRRRRVRRTGWRSALACWLCTLATGAFATSAYAAGMPPIHNGSMNPPKVPTKVLNCNIPGLSINGISPPLGSFKNCIEGRVQSYADASVAELQAQLNELIPAAADQCLTQAGTGLQQALNTAKTNPTAFAQKHVSDTLSFLQSGAGSALNLNLKQPLNDAARMQHFEQVLLAQLDRDPLAKCVFNLSSGVRGQLISQANTVASNLRSQMQGWYQQYFQAQVQGAVQTAVANAMNQLKGSNLAVSGQLPTAAVRAQAGQRAKAMARPAPRTRNIVADAVPEEVTLIAKGLVYERLLNTRRLSDLSRGIDAFVAQSARGNVPATTVSNLQNGLQSAGTLADNLALDLGVRVLRTYGHKTIETVGEPLVELAFEYIRGYKTTGGEVLDVPCSTPSVPGGAVCGVAWWAVNIALDFAWWQLELATEDAIHAAFDKLVDEHHANLQSNGTPYQQLAANPVFGPVASLLPSEAELIDVALPEIRAAVSAFRGYQSSVARLAGAAAGNPRAGAQRLPQGR